MYVTSERKEKTCVLQIGRFPWGETDASRNIQLVKIGLVRSVEWERGTGMDHISPALPHTPWFQVGYDTVCAMYKKNEHCQSINVCVNNDAKRTNPIWSFAG